MDATLQALELKTEEKAEKLERMNGTSNRLG